MPKLPKFLQRRHRISRDFVDTLGWKHPRPTVDPRLVCLHVGLAWVAVIQLVVGAGPSSVQTRAFSDTAMFAFSLLMIVCSVLVVYAAFCRSQYASWGWELAGCTGFTAVFGLFSVALISTTPQWWATTGAAWSLAFFAGNAVRAGILIWRFW